MTATKRKVDFTNVKDAGQFRPRHRKSGDYVAKIVAVDDHESNAGNVGWVFTVQIDGDSRSTYPVYCGSDEKQAWKVRKLFIACGREVPKKLVIVDPNKLLNSKLGVFLDDDEYEGRMRSRIEDYMTVDEVSDNGDDDADSDVDDDDTEVEETPPPRKRAAAKKTVPPPDDDDDDADDADDDEPAPPPRKRAAAKTTRRAAATADDDDLELDEL